MNINDTAAAAAAVTCTPFGTQMTQLQQVILQLLLLCTLCVRLGFFRFFKKHREIDLIWNNKKRKRKRIHTTALP